MQVVQARPPASYILLDSLVHWFIKYPRKFAQPIYSTFRSKNISLKCVKGYTYPSMAGSNGSLKFEWLLSLVKVLKFIISFIPHIKKKHAMHIKQNCAQIFM